MSLREEATAPRPLAKDGGQPAPKRTSVRWKLFILLLVLVTVNYVDRGSISVALPELTGALFAGAGALP